MPKLTLYDRLQRIKKTWWGVLILSALTAISFVVGDFTALIEKFVEWRPAELNVVLSTEPFEGYGQYANSEVTGEPSGGARAIFKTGALVTLRFENTHPKHRIDVTAIAVDARYDPEVAMDPYRTGLHNPKGAVEESYDVLHGPDTTTRWRGPEGRSVATQPGNLLKFQAGGATDRRCRPGRAKRRPVVRGRGRVRADFRSGEGVCFPEPAEKICKDIQHPVKPFVGGVGLGVRLSSPALTAGHTAAQKAVAERKAKGLTWTSRFAS